MRPNLPIFSLTVTSGGIVLVSLSYLERNDFSILESLVVLDLVIELLVIVEVEELKLAL